MHRRRLLLLLLLLLLALAPGCGEEAAPGFTLFSEAFGAGQPIPERHTCDGAPVPDVSPPLAWLRMPALVQSYALVVDTRSGEFQDAPQVLWVVYGIPATLEALDENIGHRTDLTKLGAKPGLNHQSKAEYIGPCPPAGEAFTYRFWLYALDTSTVTGSWTEPTAAQLRDAIKGHVLDTAKLEATYTR